MSLSSYKPVSESLLDHLEAVGAYNKETEESIYAWDIIRKASSRYSDLVLAITNRLKGAPTTMCEAWEMLTSWKVTGGGQGQRESASDQIFFATAAMGKKKKRPGSAGAHGGDKKRHKANGEHAKPSDDAGRESQGGARKPSSSICFKCGEDGHFAKDCKNERRCYNCKKPGHVTADCPTPNPSRYPVSSNVLTNTPTREASAVSSNTTVSANGSVASGVAQSNDSRGGADHPASILR